MIIIAGIGAAVAVAVFITLSLVLERHFDRWVVRACRAIIGLLERKAAARVGGDHTLDLPHQQRLMRHRMQQLEVAALPPLVSPPQPPPVVRTRRPAASERSPVVAALPLPAPPATLAQKADAARTTRWMPPTLTFSRLVADDDAFENARTAVRRRPRS